MWIIKVVPKAQREASNFSSKLNKGLGILSYEASKEEFLELLGDAVVLVYESLPLFGVVLRV